MTKTALSELEGAQTVMGIPGQRSDLMDTEVLTLVQSR